MKTYTTGLHIHAIPSHINDLTIRLSELNVDLLTKNREIFLCRSSGGESDEIYS
jgi:hypothetical protein